MSQENVEIVRSMYRPGDPSQFFELLHEGVQVDVSKLPLLPDHPDLIGGKEAALDLYRDFWGTWAEYVLEPVEIIDAGQDRVIVVQDERGKGKGSGAPFERRRWAVLYTLRDAKIVRIEHFRERRDALEAAGLSE
jgi:ketosteroid isomerase-like protein